MSTSIATSPEMNIIAPASEVSFSPGSSATTTAGAWPSRTFASIGGDPSTLQDVRRILVTGMSGTGKSTALVELGRRGFRVVDTDSPSWSEWAQDEWLWREDRIADLLAAEDERPLFVSGCMSNQVKFYDRFEAVVLLSAPAEVILERVERRTTNDYGKTPAARGGRRRAGRDRWVLRALKMSRPGY